MTTTEQILDVARRELGTAENPSGSNNVKYNTWYYGHPVTGGAYPWCAVFQSWVAQNAGATDIIPRHAYTPSGAAWFKARGAFNRTPRVGSLVYYDIAGMGRISHIGIVEAVNSDGSWVAIEGNTDGGGSRTGGRVMRQRRRSVGVLGGFGHPAYQRSIEVHSVKATEAIPPKAPAPAPGPVPLAKYPFTGTLKVGSKGDSVWHMQARLNAHRQGQRLSTIDVDGDYGKNTAATVTWFQKVSGRGLEVDGICGPNTWREIFA